MQDGSLSVAAALDYAMKRLVLAHQTVRVYRSVADLFAEHCKGLTVQGLTRRVLSDFAAERLKAPKRTARAGGKRGEQIDAGERSKHSTNRELRALSSLLNTLRRADILRLTRDDIGDGLARVRAPVELRPFLHGPEIRELLRVAARHDAQTFKLDRKGSKDRARFKPIAPFIRAAVLLGARLDELLSLEWPWVRDGRIYLPAIAAKGARARMVDLAVSPTALPAQSASASAGRVFDLTRGEVYAARKRLLAMGAPAFTWHALRRTCGTFLTCAPGIYAGASAAMSAQRLGHDVSVAQRHYVGQATVDPAARTLEQALGLADAGVGTAAANAQRVLNELVDRAAEWVGGDIADQLRTLLEQAPPPKT
jgi:hypothetical protein